MGLIFRQRFKIFPGVHLNLSANGLSVSLGAPGATINLSPKRGARLALGIPGTGLSYRGSLNPLINRNSSDFNPQFSPQANYDGNSPFPGIAPFNEYEGRKIHSATVEELALVGNADLQRLIKESHENYEKMSREVRDLEKTAVGAERLAGIMDNILFRQFLKKKILNLQQEANSKRREYDEAKEIFDSYGLKLDWNMDNDIQQIYSELFLAFQEASRSVMIWDVTTEKQTNKFRQRTIADKLIERTAISFTLGRPVYMPAGVNERWKMVPQINDASGSVIYIFPGFFIFSGVSNFAVIEPKDIEIVFGQTSYQEEENIPSDTKITGHTWKKSNKDGSPDKRFNGNFQIPVVGYGKFRLASREGIEEEYMLSNLEATLKFGTALERFCAWFKHHDSGQNKATIFKNMDMENLQPSFKEAKPMEPDKFIEQFNTDREILMKPLLTIAKENNFDASDTLFSSFQNIGISMCGADKVIMIDEAKAISFLGDLFPNMEHISSESWFNSMSGKSDDEWIDISSRGRQKFGALYFLGIYDEDNGTNYAQTLKQLLFEFALIIANADGEISSQEASFLQQLKQDIFKDNH
jgi:hypothetical protein